MRKNVQLQNLHLAATKILSASEAFRYFSDHNFESSQVIRIDYDEETHELLLTVRYAMTPQFREWLVSKKKPDSPVSDFRLLVFKGIQDLQIDGIWLGNQGGEVYSVKNSGVYLIDSIELKQEADLNIRIALTSSSYITFSFKEFGLNQKFAHAIEGAGKNEWKYIDDESGELLDFYAPFEQS